MLLHTGIFLFSKYCCVYLRFLSETLSCLTEMNEARTAAGLPAFGEASGDTKVLPPSSISGRQVDAAAFWTEICKEIKGVSLVTAKLLSLVPSAS